MFSKEELQALASGIDALIKHEGIAALQNGRMAVYATCIEKLQQLAIDLDKPKTEEPAE